MVILYNPPSSAGRKPILPCSLLALGAVLQGHRDYEIVDANLLGTPVRPGDTIEMVDQRLIQTGARVLAVTVMPGPQLQDAVPLCAELKRRHPDLIVIWGGYFPSQHWRTALRAPYVDYVIRGHGELAFAELLNRLDEGQIRPEIQGICFRDSEAEPIDGGMPKIPKPSELPTWPHHKVRVEDYLRPTFLGSKTIGHHSSYGCPYFCGFCAVVNMVNGAWVPEKADRIAQTVRMLVEDHGANAIEFYDNNFFVAERRVRRFAESIMDLGISWWGEGRIDTMLNFSDETWQVMADSGLKMVFLGAESGSDETLRRMNKGGKQTVSQTTEMARKMAHYGIVPEYSFVLGNPPDPERDVKETMDFVRQIKKINPATEVILYMYTPVPLDGTLFEEAKSSGFAFPETLEGWVSDEWRQFAQRRSRTMPWIGYPIQQRLQDFERVLNAYHPTSTLSHLKPVHRRMLRWVSSWRYHSGFYRWPIELRVLHRLLRYRRPETSGF
ncbi:MAG TPA: B12-binding domain-containing radical SAM protein [Myxococcales bacterium]|nr:B12-binding domain-containing radical SAM protein [Myxococcales bacterium]HAN31019.1 B12-binding domain-containing radical SAM protein [Myxococcales bacterium]